jgi:acetyl-CoA synthetase
VNTTNYLNVQLKVPNKFNWVRDVFEPLIVHSYGDRNMLELVTDDPTETLTLTYKQGSEKCNQLLNLLRKQGVRQGDDVFIMCGLNGGLWISYLSAIKGGLILIPAASILTVNDIVYRFEKAAPKVIIADKDNAEKMDQALLQYDHPVKVKLLLDGEKDGWISYSVIDKEEKKSKCGRDK